MAKYFLNFDPKISHEFPLHSTLTKPIINPIVLFIKLHPDRLINCPLDRKLSKDYVCLQRPILVYFGLLFNKMAIVMSLIDAH